MSRIRDWTTSVRAWMIGLLALIVFVIVYYIATDRITPFTTDAYVQSFVVQVAPRVEGQVVSIAVKQGGTVKKGDPLFTIDPRPYQYAVDRLKAELVEAQTAVKQLQTQLDGQNDVVSQREANVTLAQATFDRISTLAKDNFAAQQSLDNATNTLKTNTALWSEAKASVANIQAELDSMIDGEHSQVAQVKAELASAELKLAETTVHASVDGVIDNLQLSVGTYIDIGTAVMTLVDTSDWWIVANYPENALSVIEPGQSVRLSYLMYPGVIVTGKVASIGWGVSAGQGQATGQLPEVVNPDAWITRSQRFQVRITPDRIEHQPLRVGATVRTVVLTGDNPLMNGLALFWLWIGAQLDYIY